MATINISGYEVTVDAEDVARILEAGPWYSKVEISRGTKVSVVSFVSRTGIRLHRFILGASKGRGPTVNFRTADRRNLKKSNLVHSQVATLVPSMVTDPVNSKRILIDSLFVLIDAEDVSRILFKGYWRLYCDIGTWQYFSRAVRVGNRFVNESLHRFIVCCPKGKVVDHINGDTMDNRKCNLRIVDHRTNGYNSKISKRNASGLKGVFLDKKRGGWRAYLGVNGKLMQSKIFITKEEATAARVELENTYAHGMLMGETGRA